jgi:hypothetical protein
VNGKPPGIPDIDAGATLMLYAFAVENFAVRIAQAFARRQRDRDSRRRLLLITARRMQLGSSRLRDRETVGGMERFTERGRYLADDAAPAAALTIFSPTLNEACSTLQWLENFSLVQRTPCNA